MPHVYGLDANARAFAHTAQQLADEVLARHAAKVDREARFPADGLRALAAERLLGLTVASEHGGHGAGLRAFVAVAEELARGCASTAMIYVMHTAATQAIAASTLADRDAVLAQIARGEHLTTLALSEKGSRSQFWAPVSQLRAQGDGFVTTAAKSWVTSANEADSYVSSAQMPGAESPLQSTLYLARTQSDAVRPQPGFDGLGLRGNDSAPVSLEELPLGKSDLMTGQGKGADMMLQVILPWFAVGTAAMAHGLCRASVAATTAHLTSTTFAHDGKALRDLPQLRARLAEMHTRTEASRSLLARTLGEMEAGSAEAALFVLSARKLALTTVLDVTDLAMKACGGAAFSRQTAHAPIERMFRDARAGWVMAPTVDHLDDFIGKALTGLPLF